MTGARHLNKLAFLLPVIALAACGEEPAPEPAPTTAVAEPAEPGLPPADEAMFTQLFASTCPDAEPVATAVCKRAMGADTAVCEFGLGEDTELRHEAQIAGMDGEWSLVDAPAICAEHDSHHVDS